MKMHEKLIQINEKKVTKVSYFVNNNLQLLGQAEFKGMKTFNSNEIIEE